MLQCIKYEESLLSLLLSPHIPMPEKGTHFLSGSGERQAQSWAHCRQGKQQGGVALPKFFLQAWHACEAQAPLGLSSHTHLIVIAGLGNKVLFNSESIWQAGRAGSVGCQPCQLPRADPVWLQRSGLGALPQHLLPWHPTAPCRLCLHPLPVPAKSLGWSQRMVFFLPCSIKGFPETGVAFPILGVTGDTVV